LWLLLLQFWLYLLCQNLIKPYQEKIEASYFIQGKLPTENRDIDMPKPEEIRGNYLASAQLKDGAIHLTFGQKMADQHHGEILTVRPVFVESKQATPLSWVCGNDSIPEGMKAATPDKTTLDEKFLPLRCR